MTTPNIDAVFSIPPEKVTNGQLLMILQAMHTQNQITNSAFINLNREFSEYKKQHEEMVETWKAGKTVLGVIKIAGTTAVAITAAYVGIKALLNHFTHG